MYVEGRFRDGKLNSSPRAETVGETGKRQNRLHVFDRITGQRFLVDTGAEISILPKRHYAIKRS